MNRDDIVHRINFSSAHSVCIHRDIISNELSEIVKSIYIENSDNEKYTIAIEFDPTEMVGQGDGWIWNSTPTNLDNIVKILENHTNKKYPSGILLFSIIYQKQVLMKQIIAKH
ncbi:hypothetical protein [Obesumbacterium proteus]|uniref:hypothetical protein n=1 Tax=Obesumbacterium proteus TaxID=82983 RepID=UPI000778CEEF|nr:hypothetical protein [Obesumbacterium proteus]AMO82533.1 hypothetical protein DSM2777_16730 [Obesumbacterium proteus]